MSRIKSKAKHVQCQHTPLVVITVPNKGGGFGLPCQPPPLTLYHMSHVTGTGVGQHTARHNSEHNTAG